MSYNRNVRPPPLGGTGDQDNRNNNNSGPRHPPPPPQNYPPPHHRGASSSNNPRVNPFSPQNRQINNTMATGWQNQNRNLNMPSANRAPTLHSSDSMLPVPGGQTRSLYLPTPMNMGQNNLPAPNPYAYGYPQNQQRQLQPSQQPSSLPEAQQLCQNMQPSPAITGMPYNSDQLGGNMALFNEFMHLVAVREANPQATFHIVIPPAAAQQTTTQQAAADPGQPEWAKNKKNNRRGRPRTGKKKRGHEEVSESGDEDELPKVHPKLRYVQNMKHKENFVKKKPEELNCSLCHENGHHCKYCNRPPGPEGINYACPKCGINTHIIDDCPEMPSRATQRDKWEKEMAHLLVKTCINMVPFATITDIRTLNYFQKQGRFPLSPAEAKARNQAGEFEQYRGEDNATTRAHTYQPDPRWGNGTMLQEYPIGTFAMPATQNAASSNETPKAPTGAVDMEEDDLISFSSG